MIQSSTSMQKRFYYSGITGLYLFAFFSWFGTAGANIALVIILVATIVNWRRFWPLIKNDAIFPIFLLTFIYILITGAHTAFELPATANLHWKETKGWLILVFPLLTLWLVDDHRRVGWVLALAALGLIIDMLQFMIIHSDWSELVRALGARWAFNFGKAQGAIGLYISTILLGLILFAKHICGNPSDPIKFTARLIGWALLLILMIQAIILTTSRGSWLSLALVTPLVLAVWTFQKVRHRQIKHPRLILFVSITLILSTAALLQSNFTKIERQFLYEKRATLRLLSGNLDRVPYSSFGTRIHLYRNGLKKWMEKPLFGWGPGTSKVLISSLEDEKLRTYPHFHSTYVEILVQLGTVGALLFCSMVFLLLKRVWRNYRAGLISVEMFLFITGSFAMLAVWSLTNFRMTRIDWAFYWILLAGITHAYSVIHLTNKTQSQTCN